MSRPILHSSKNTYIQGEIALLVIKVWDELNLDTDLSAATATFVIYDDDSVIILPSGAATIAGTTLINVARLWNTTAVVPGVYRVVVTVNIGTVSQKFQYKVNVLPNPAP